MASVEFRDGYREVPDHVAALLAGYAADVFRLTYEEAIELANKELVRQHANAAAERIVREHLTTFAR
jgi:hypothetical protein